MNRLAGGGEPFVGMGASWAVYYWHLRFGSTKFIPYELRELIHGGGDQFGDRHGRLRELRDL